VPSQPPQPLVQAFVVCREMFESPRSGELVLVTPFSRITMPVFPAAASLSVYAHLTDARGRNDVSLKLEDAEGNEVWQWEGHARVEEADPLMPHRIALYDVLVGFSGPGRYDLVMTANSTDLAHHALWVRHVPVEPS
jgi:hypothetical protein